MAQQDEPRVGCIVTPSGAGRTRTWGHLTGTVTRVAGRSVFVAWHSTCVEDQMARDEVVLVRGLPLSESRR